MGGGVDGHGTTYKGITIHHPKRWHMVTGMGMCALMWFWILYRAKQDGPVVSFGTILCFRFLQFIVDEFAREIEFPIGLFVCIYVITQTVMGMDISYKVNYLGYNWLVLSLSRKVLQFFSIPYII